MPDFSAAISIWCDDHYATKPRRILIEPWGEDYWLFPGDEFEIKVIGKEGTPYFTVVEADEYTQVYIETIVTDLGNLADFEVFHNGEKVVCGYQRAKLLGSAYHAMTILGRGIVIASDHPWQNKFQTGDHLRLVIPQKTVMHAEILGIEHFYSGPDNPLANPLGIFVGEIGISAKEILPTTMIYRLTLD